MGGTHKSEILEFLKEMREADEEWGVVHSPGEFSDVVERVGSLAMCRPILRLFEASGSDYRNPNSWLATVGLIADILFDVRRAGRRPRWSRLKTQIMTRDFTTCLKENPKLSGMQIAVKMKSRFPRKYGPVPASTILRLVGAAGVSIKAIKSKVRDTRPDKKVRRNAERTSA